MADFRIERLNTVIIPVKDLERSIHFYHNVLRLHKGFVDKSMAYFSFGSDDHQPTILLHIMDEPEPVEKGMVIELLVDDLTSAVSSIKNAGGEIVQVPIDREWGVKEAVIADPDGYKIWIVQTLG
ncbi:VOC family protein [Tenuibacillus multivorans]|uniref:Lactoylglutathione lyase n=1 Tax=Tenuibacillus multivorans TaxID=237069 RepID=A0A1H0FG86_9BACI|nr:VOC family protein [Tenuibacillus multivorans]SDN93552.1 lactoylglutathione lyase [Tenuibacillus multivorans]